MEIDHEHKDRADATPLSDATRRERLIQQSAPSASVVRRLSYHGNDAPTASGPYYSIFTNANRNAHAPSGDALTTHSTATLSTTLSRHSSAAAATGGSATANNNTNSAPARS
jgi:hypothetical protein